MVIYDHPHEGHAYCDLCGWLELVQRPGGTTWEPIGDVWRSRGWWCYRCNSKVWWLREGALFLKEVPIDTKRVGGRLRMNRYNWECLLCDCDLDHQPTFYWMICPRCWRVWQGSFQSWAIANGLPDIARDRIHSFRWPV